MTEKNSILIVDDEKASLMYLNHLLGVDYVIYTARDAEDALEKANKYLPDLILLDIIMPGMNGYEALVSLKGSNVTKDIPVIFITGLSGNDDEIKGLDTGAEDYITKPFNNTIVKLRVRNQIKMVNQMRTIERLSMIDHLTDIANRRSFNLQMEREWRRAIRTQSPISLIMVDVDKFKIYNHTYGYPQGDIVLQKVVDLVKQNLSRAADFMARLGGEKFAVLLPMTDMTGALSIAENIRTTVESTIIPCLNGVPTNITVSIGVNSQMPSQDDSVDFFIFQADNALFTAKEMGRNRACTIH